jgi:hypothetical protein
MRSAVLPILTFGLFAMVVADRVSKALAATADEVGAGSSVGADLDRGLSAAAIGRLASLSGNSSAARGAERTSTR